MRKVIAFITHYLGSKTRHGIHSPFVYNLIDKCLYQGSQFSQSAREHYKGLERSKEYLEGMDFGKNEKVKVKVSELASRSATRDFEATLVAKVVRYFGSRRYLELGTNIGKATSIVALTNPKTIVHSIEGNTSIADFARKSIQELELANVRIENSTFDEFFDQNSTKYDCIFIDGDHRYEPTLKNYENAKQSLIGEGLIILHDIYWSRGMTDAWKKIVADKSATVTIDLFFFGMVFFRPSQAKEHFRIRYPKNLLRIFT